LTPPAAASSAWAAAARLVRATSFGGNGTAIDAAAAIGPAAYLTKILAADPVRDAGALATPAPELEVLPKLGKDADPAARKARNKEVSAQTQQLTTWWIRRMVAAEQPFGERLTLTWHNHFATSNAKVRNARWMLAQNQKLRTLGRGDFRTLALAMLTDAAMLSWLDGQQNTVGAPNENLSREFLELFALGHGDGYTEQDVREGARALTGWRINPDGSTVRRAALHDDSGKTMLGVTGNLDEKSYCDAALAPAAAPRYLVTRMYGQLVSDHAPTVAAVSAGVDGYGSGRSIPGLVTALLGSPDFVAAMGTRVIGPVEWLVGALRALRVPMEKPSTVQNAMGVLRGLGQLPFAPPTVAGWPSGAAWLSTAAADLRMSTAMSLAAKADLDPINSAAASERIAATGYLLGIGSWSDRTAAVLKGFTADPKRLVTVALNSPEYLTY